MSGHTLAIFVSMSGYSVVEAKNRLSEPIVDALAGDVVVVITRQGQPVVGLRSTRASGRPVTEADLDWLAARRVGRVMPAEDAGTLVRRMRDEDEDL
jgi:antitoxin (DNA-binding transcriptional repressor) of toxin-antitoxin stability system